MGAPTTSVSYVDPERGANKMHLRTLSSAVGTEATRDASSVARDRSEEWYDCEP